ncbi:ABC transporter permease subunit [Candidatus Paracaedibacter symbiosus]|uniref:ABC transporter permease subunit n=1 Tax=Candidatus Paracaedibacter symbiosus TaxID=244582 RepID=UPI00068C3BE8|nr:ABC transporter permease subunit [Candidatus Paracaedibacter symbiosus]
MLYEVITIAIPVIIKTSESVFRLVPRELKEAAAALGAPRWKLFFRIILPISKTGIITGIILSIARISGETAPLLFTSLNNQFLSWNMDHPIASLPIVIFQYAMSPYTDWHDLAWAGALLLTVFVLTLNIIVRVIFRKKIILN